MSILIRTPNEDEYQSWQEVYQSYLDFYQTELDEKQLQQVWQWIKEKKDGMHCYFAIYENQVVGLTHFRTFIRPIRAQQAIFMDDLIVLPKFHGKGIGYALIDAIKQFAQKNKFPLIRWITAEDNQKAIRLYDRVAKRTSWLTYDLV